MLRTRIYTVLVLLPLFAAALFLTPRAAWALLLMPLLFLGAWEWSALAGWHGARRAAYALLLGAVALLLWFYTPLRGIALAASVLFWLVMAPLWLARGWRVQSAWAMAAAGAVLLLPLWLALVLLHATPWLLLALMSIVWISDTAAYFCGRRWGRHKLAPSISPGKTWEGVYGATAAVTVYCVVLQAVGHALPAILQGLAGCGVFLGLMALGIGGDLFESWIKRTAGVKDSGTVFPGHGGVLDRVDALTASMPAAALLLTGVV
jgi:phosphatidate cytidylyltransferase